MNKEVLKFNSKIYSGESIKQAIDEYRKNFKKGNLSNLKKRGSYFELEIEAEKYPKNFLKEFCNYVLYLNCK
jgi:hypothetical protein